MLDQLIEFGKQQLGGQLQSQAGLNAGQVDQSLDLAKGSLIDTFKEQALGGNLNGVLDLFNGQSAVNAQNPVVNAAIGHFSGALTEKMGLSAGTAKIVTDTVIPFLLNRFASNETGSATSPEALMQMIGPDGDNAIGGILKGVMGGKDSGDLLGGIGKLFG